MGAFFNIHAVEGIVGDDGVVGNDIVDQSGTGRPPMPEVDPIAGIDDDIVVDLPGMAERLAGDLVLVCDHDAGIGFGCFPPILPVGGVVDHIVADDGMAGVGDVDVFGPVVVDGVAFDEGIVGVHHDDAFTVIVKDPVVANDGI